MFIIVKQMRFKILYENWKTLRKTYAAAVIRQTYTFFQNNLFLLMFFRQGLWSMQPSQ